MPVSQQSGPVQNPIDPDQIPTAERLREIAHILAVGFLRHWVRRTAREAKKGLAIRATPSDSCIEPTSEGETTA